MSEISAKNSLAASRFALLREMGVPASPSRSDTLLTADVSVAASAVNKAPVKQQPLWMVIGKKTISRWWTSHPLNLALQIAQPALRPYARRNPAVVVAVGAGAGALLYVLRPWRLLSLTSLAALLIRTPAIPKLALQLVQASQRGVPPKGPKVEALVSSRTSSR